MIWLGLYFGIGFFVSAFSTLVITQAALSQYGSARPIKIVSVFLYLWLLWLPLIAKAQIERLMRKGR